MPLLYGLFINTNKNSIKIAKKRTAALGNMQNIREKQLQNYVSKSPLFTRDLNANIYKRGIENRCMIR